MRVGAFSALKDKGKKVEAIKYECTPIIIHLNLIRISKKDKRDDDGGTLVVIFAFDEKHETPINFKSLGLDIFKRIS